MLCKANQTRIVYNSENTSDDLELQANKLRNNLPAY